MKPRREDDLGTSPLGAHGFGGFLRSLLAGVPWSERAECDEALRFANPSSRSPRPARDPAWTRAQTRLRRARGSVPTERLS